MTLKDLPEILSAQQVASYLGISRKRVYELFKLHVDHGGIPNFDIGFSKRVRKEDLISWIDEKIKQKIG